MITSGSKASGRRMLGSMRKLPGMRRRNKPNTLQPQLLLLLSRQEQGKSSPTGLSFPWCLLQAGMSPSAMVALHSSSHQSRRP